jgi:hypothetical protein
VDVGPADGIHHISSQVRTRDGLHDPDNFLEALPHPGREDRGGNPSFRGQAAGDPP